MDDGDLHDAEYPDTIPRIIAGLNAHLDQPLSTGAHVHRKAQILYAITGSVKVETGEGLWHVPSSCAIWIPGGLPHNVRNETSAHVGNIFVDPDIVAGLPRRCVMIFVQPLLRELMARVLATGETPIDPAQEARLAAVFVDELAAAPEEVLRVPRAQDERLQKLLEAMIGAPSKRTSLGEWAARVGASESTLNRLFLREVGMTFVRWRQLLHVRIALHELAQRRPVGLIAFDLGYDSPSAFITMFKSVMGVTPAKYAPASAAMVAASGAAAEPVDDRKP